MVIKYRDADSSGESKRVWQDSWGGDQFEVFDAVEFANLQHICKRMSIPLVEAEPD